MRPSPVDCGRSHGRGRPPRSGVLGDAGLLAQARQRVIFAHEGDDGPPSPAFADHGGGNAGDILGDAKTLMAQLGEMFGERARLGVTHLGHGPDPVAQIDETRLDRVNAKPDVAAVVHIAVLGGRKRERNCYQLRQAPPSIGGVTCHAQPMRLP